MTVCVRKAVSQKKGKLYYALVLRVNGKEHAFFLDLPKVCELLDLKPSEVYTLEAGDYEIVQKK